VSKLGFTRWVQSVQSDVPAVPGRLFRRSDFPIRSRIGSVSVRRTAHWLFHLLLFLLTFFTCTVFGFALLQSFSARRGFDLDFIGDGYARLARGDWSVLSGVCFSAPLLIILLAHEFGHYLACRRWGVQASLPYFLPSPTLLGTLGAFIRIRSPIYTRTSLFDIGASGPIAGFLVLLPFLILGIHWSREIPGIAVHGDMIFGTPLLLRLAEAIQFPGVRSADISLHPTAVAAWAGLVATATNLLPVGQLDGGHILYSVLGDRWHRISSNLFVVLLVGVGFIYRPWWLLAVLLFVFGRRHPLVYDRTPVDHGRRLMSIATLVIFLLSILLAPVEVHIR
jgi:Zn-dependent protease